MLDGNSPVSFGRRWFRRISTIGALALAFVLFSANMASAQPVTPRSGEGIYSMTLRTCGNASTWRTQAARNGVTESSGWLVLFGRTYDIQCTGATSAPAANTSTSNATWQHPLPGRCAGSGFGWRNGRIHNGVDIPAPVGTNVRAAAAGTVTWGNDPGGAGWYMMINHGGGVWTAYFHLSSRLVSAGSWVNAGQHIAESGGAPGAPGAGNSTGPHLHFEVHPWGQWVKAWSNSLGANAYTNPVTFMSARGVRISC